VPKWASRFFGCLVPEDDGGNGLGFRPRVDFEEIARHSAIRVYLNMQAGRRSRLRNSAARQKKFLPALLNGETVGCFAITEPDTGSDVASMKTTATRDGDGYLLNGTKIWITNATVADAGIIFAYTDRSQKHRGMSAFYVDLNQPGISRRELDKLGTHASPTGELAFENFRVARERLIGQEGDGFKICMRHLNHTRLGCAAGAVGLARAARDAAVSYANQREQFGQKIGEFQMNQDLIAQMVVQEEAARLLVYAPPSSPTVGTRTTWKSRWRNTPAARRRHFARTPRLRYSAPTAIPRNFPWNDTIATPSHTKSSRGL
jgi:glutaryl-CoA dehydrogenase (non-decarboxylating)